ncbi:hypothetical protein [Nocardia acidivorans]|uniref:hypothetical protein n=1 Tax=Nocardia acidivorans TaxID=404580 RepID=UPI0008301E5A|nr:hypothetical protein [Nocardia acidivorans]
MDVSVLHSLTEDLASYLSEVTRGDLGCMAPSSARDVRGVYRHLIDRSIAVATAIAAEPISGGQWGGMLDGTSPEAAADPYYGSAGLEVGYRYAAGLVEVAFSSITDPTRRCRVPGLESEIDIATLYEEYIGDVVIHTWDLACALGLTYEPPSDIARRVLRSTVLRMTRAPSTATGASPEFVDADAFASLLTLSGRTR